MSNGSGLFGSQRAQVPHLVQPGGGLAGEVADLRRDIAASLAALAAISVDDYVNPAAGGVAALKAATASSIAVQTITSFLAPGLAMLLAFGRNITVTTSGVTPADAPATVLLTGTYRGLPQTETINVPQTATTTVGVKPFDTLESAVYSAGQGVDALVSIGVGDALGTRQLPRLLGGGYVIVREIAVGVLVTTGALTVEGLYTPAAAPDGTKDYAIFYPYTPV